MAGGVAAKLGLFKGLWVALLAAKKFIIPAVAAIAAWFRKLFKGKAPGRLTTKAFHSLRAKLRNVTDAQIVMLRVSNINGDGQSRGDVPFGFLLADVNSSRTGDRPDGKRVNFDKNQTVTASNFRDDIDLTGAIEIRDLRSARINLGHSLP